LVINSHIPGKYNKYKPGLLWNKMMRIYNTLLAILGNQHWWPADTAFEVAVGALLTQQTRWNNVEQAISNLKNKSLMEPEKLANADSEIIEELVRCTGFYRQKAHRLIIMSEFFLLHGDAIFNKPVEELRKDLLELEGVGEETADSIILYAANKPKFVIDAYTRKILNCLGISGNYSQLQHIFEAQLDQDVELYKEFHALIVEYGKQYCLKHRCEECVLIDVGKTLI
jgi:endonuclease-3 related protein